MIKKFLFINILVELIGGAIIVFFPFIISFDNNMNEATILLARLVGVQAIFIGALLYFIFKIFEISRAVNLLPIMLLIYNITAAICTFVMYSNKDSLTIIPTALHFVISVVWVFLIFFDFNKIKTSELS